MYFLEVLSIGSAGVDARMKVLSAEMGWVEMGGSAGRSRRPPFPVHIHILEPGPQKHYLLAKTPPTV
jgi:hypothetical protein